MEPSVPPLPVLHRGMSTHGKIALGLFFLVFILTRAAKATMRLTARHEGSMTPTVFAGLFCLAGTALVCAVLVLVALYLRRRAAQAPGGKPVTWWKWGLLCLATAGFASEAVAFFAAIGLSLIK